MMAKLWCCKNNLIPIATDKKHNSYFDLSSLPNHDSHSVFFVLLKISSLSFSPNKTKHKVPTEMCAMSASGLHFECRINSNSWLVMGDAQILSVSILSVLKREVSWITLQMDSSKWEIPTGSSQRDAFYPSLKCIDICGKGKCRRSGVC